MELTQQIEVGGGAIMKIVDPRSFDDGGVEWRLRYGNPEQVRYIAASVIESYDYLLSSNITAKEAIRRLRLMHAARRELR